MIKLSVAIVLFENNVDSVRNAVNSVLNCSIQLKLYLIDNSSTDRLRILKTDDRVEYIFTNSNLGYGKAHNIAIDAAIMLRSKYHLVLNPDIYFESIMIEKMIDYLDLNLDVGQLMPKVLYPNGEIQKLCKLMPSPFDLLSRRFLFFKDFFYKRSICYELPYYAYNQILDLGTLSGCFMLIRTNVLKKVGGFDDRFFMYLEDYDLTRRINKYSRTIYFPYASVFHLYTKGSYVKYKLMVIHIKSAIKYFNKWGWFFDNDRKKINDRIIKAVLLYRELN